MTRTRALWCALVCAFAVLAAACGSSSSSATKTNDTSLIGARNDVSNALSSSTTAASAATDQSSIKTIQDWEALWTKERATVVQKIKDNGWGWDQTKKVVTGPGGFNLDLSKCPSGWDPYGGLQGGVAHIGQTLPQSGTLADYGNIAVAQKVLYDYVNAQGGIKDSTGKTYTMQTDVRDDAYDPAKTVPQVDELLDSTSVFAIQTLGSPSTMKVYDKLNQRCEPNPYAMTGHPAWGDPVNHPWTWGTALTYNTEAVLWGGLLEKKFGDTPITVAALIMQNDFGKAYELGFNQFLATTKMKINFVFERIDPTAPTITNQMTTLAAKKPDVFIAMTAGTSCTQAVTEAANDGLKASAKMLITGQPCKGLNFMGKDKVGGDGGAADGWWIAGGGSKDFNDKSLATDPYISWARDQLSKAGHPSEGSSQLGNGYYYGWPVVEAMLIAAELPGGLSKPNFVLAARTLSMTNPTLLNGVKFNMSGNDDPYPIEGSEIAVFSGSAQSWKTQTDLGIIDLSGRSKPCAWNQATGTCA